MNRHSIKCGTALPLACGLALVLGFAACAGRGLERYPPAVDHDQLNLRMEALRAQRLSEAERLRRARLDYVDLDPHGIRANGGRIAALNQGRARDLEVRRQQFDRLSGATGGSAQALREKRARDLALRQRNFDRVSAAADQQLFTALDRSEAYAEHLALIARAEARVMAERLRRRAEAEAALRRAAEISARQSSRIQARQAAFEARQRRARQAREEQAPVGG